MHVLILLQYADSKHYQWTLGAAANMEVQYIILLFWLRSTLLACEQAI